MNHFLEYFPIGLCIEHTIAYTYTTTTPFRITSAIMENAVDASGKIDKDEVWIKTNAGEYLIASMTRTQPHVNLDVTFIEGEVVIFNSRFGKVHLSGHYVLPVDYKTEMSSDLR